MNRVLARLAEKARKLKLNPTEKESKRHCEEHQEELKLFCETDTKLICVICRVAREHKSHSVIPIKEAVEMYKDQSRSLESHISSEFTKIHQSLTEKEQRLIGNLRKREERVVNIMERNLRKIQKNLTSIEEELSMLQKQMEQEDGVIFLKEESCRKKRVGCDQTLTVIDGALTKEEFAGPLPFPVWREMFDDIHPAAASTAALKPWKGTIDDIRNKSMKSGEATRSLWGDQQLSLNIESSIACPPDVYPGKVSVTLDVGTAHPELEVSEDGKSVRWTETRRVLPDTGKRFTVWPCALGSEGFTSGRHYWEVEVAGNQCWRLGVAAESVERERGVGLIPENGFWIIGRVGDRFYVSTSGRSRLPAAPIHGRVGVYLSYGSGTVSFYSADTKFHLHTFTGNKLTGKLYPFFWTGDEKWLRICSGSAPAL